MPYYGMACHDRLDAPVRVWRLTDSVDDFTLSTESFILGTTEEVVAELRRRFPPPDGCAEILDAVRVVNVSGEVRVHAVPYVRGCRDGAEFGEALEALLARIPVVQVSTFQVKNIRRRMWYAASNLVIDEFGYVRLDRKKAEARRKRHASWAQRRSADALRKQEEDARQEREQKAARAERDAAAVVTQAVGAAVAALVQRLERHPKLRAFFRLSVSLAVTQRGDDLVRIGPLLDVVDRVLGHGYWRRLPEAVRWARAVYTHRRRLAASLDAVAASLGRSCTFQRADYRRACKLFRTLVRLGRARTRRRKAQAAAGG